MKMKSDSRRKFMKNGSQMVLVLLLAPQLIACKGKSEVAATAVMNEELKKLMDFSISADESYQIRNLAGNLWTFEERGGTIGFDVSDDGIAIVDTQFPEQSQHLVDAIRAQTDRSIDLLINTHHHGDHTSGNTVFKELIKDSVAHSNSKKNQLSRAEDSDKVDQIFLPETVFEDSWKINLGSETVLMNYYGAGHTNGDAITTFVNTNAVHMGDLVFNRRFPYIDKSAGANIQNWIVVLDKVLESHNTETKYIFGHSDNGYDVVGNYEDIKAFQNYLERLLEFGEKSFKAGKTLEELNAETTMIPGAEEWKGDGISRSLDAVYQELS
jgi:glyoxylase-like metal-dependent hydrolase (beta-lactamase superfamily II)